MNGQRVINLPAPVGANDAVRKADIADLVDAADSADSAAASAAAAAASAAAVAADAATIFRTDGPWAVSDTPTTDGAWG
jgi:hypothetical protein